MRSSLSRDEVQAGAKLVVVRLPMLGMVEAIGREMTFETLMNVVPIAQDGHTIGTRLGVRTEMKATRIDRVVLPSKTGQQG